MCRAGPVSPLLGGGGAVAPPRMRDACRAGSGASSHTVPATRRRLLPPSLRLSLSEERAHLSPPLNPAAGRTLIPSASLPPGAGGSEAHEIAAMAGPTSRLLLLARRADRCRSLPLLLPRAVHAAAAAWAPSPTAPPPRLPASSPVRRYGIDWPISATVTASYRIPRSLFRFTFTGNSESAWLVSALEKECWDWISAVFATLRFRGYAIGVKIFAVVLLIHLSQLSTVKAKKVYDLREQHTRPGRPKCAYHGIGFHAYL